MRENEEAKPRRTGSTVAQVLLGCVVTLGASSMGVVGCGQAEEPVASVTPDASGDSAESSADAAPAEPETEIASAYSDSLGDVYDGMTNEQRATLAPGLSQEELAALTAEQLAALAQAQESDENAPETADDAEATAVNTVLGQLNMDEIREVFEQAENIEDFEEKINRIYAGPHLLLVQSRQEENEAITEAFEDLDDSGDISDTNDEIVFAFHIQRANRQARLAGRNANSYFAHEWPATYEPTGRFWLEFIVANLNRAAWRYATPRERREHIRAQIRAHRATPAWRAQRRAARAYYRRMARNPRYAKSLVSISPSRRRWRTKRTQPIVLPPPPRRMKIRVPRHQRRVKRGVVVPAPRPGAPAPPPAKVVVPAPRPGKQLQVPRRHESHDQNRPHKGQGKRPRKGRGSAHRR